MVRSATSTALRVAARELELYDTGNVDGADEVFAPNVIDHDPATEAASGIDGMRASIAAVRDGFTDTQHRILFQQELPGGWVVLHWRMTGTHTGDAFGFPPAATRSTSTARTSCASSTARSPSRGRGDRGGRPPAAAAEDAGHSSGFGHPVVRCARPERGARARPRGVAEQCRLHPAGAARGERVPSALPRLRQPALSAQ
ncbi:ester cyclase [Streptomyces violaceusniger]|uniref:ester cyclase n=1 Tax=Streptomyces violaceusniger TaxID=68280 RepID=UPI00368F18F1